jgi:hypothetical protein
VIFFENIDSNRSPVIRLCDPARDGGVRPFRDLAGERPIRPDDGAFDVLMAQIDASRAVVGKDELLSLVQQGRIVDENRQSGTRLPRCAKVLAPTAS